MVRLATRLKCIGAVPALLLLLLPLAAIGLQGQTKITKCPLVITSAGEYVLADDLNDCSNGIEIDANDVVLKLAGHRITGGTTQVVNATGILVQADRVRILGPGFISNFKDGHYGIRLFGQFGRGTQEVTGVTCIEDSRAFVWEEGNAELSANIARDDEDGFIIYPAHGLGTVSGNLSEGNQEYGFYASLTGDGPIRMVNNIAVGNGQYGIYATTYSGKFEFRANSAYGNAIYDLYDAMSTCQNKWEHNAYLTGKGPCID